MSGDRYKFGDTAEAGARLRRLAELYEPETRELLQRGGGGKPQVAVDLGCGPGWSTKLLQETLRADRTVGLDSSELYITEARRIQNSRLEFQVHDITQAPFPVSVADAMFCRFLLAHQHEPGAVLSTWAKACGPDCVLFIHETESLDTDHPTLRRYYELVGKLQQHYGQTLLVGGLIEPCMKENGWRIVESECRLLEKPIGQMAELHLPNLRMWRQDTFVREWIAEAELDALEASLAELAEDTKNKGVVVNGIRQIVARRR
jgi:trans-aconitate 2-methyltransferase